MKVMIADDHGIVRSGITLLLERQPDIDVIGEAGDGAEALQLAVDRKPDVAILPLSNNRDPQDIVHMVRLLRTENPNLKTIIPHHHRLQPPPGAPTPAALEAALKTAGLPVTVLNPDLSKVYDLTK